MRAVRSLVLLFAPTAGAACVRRCATELLALSAEMEIQQPYLIQYDSWGRRVDELVTCAAWKRQHVVAANEGLIAHGYTREYGPLSRVYQLAKLYMFSPSSGLYSQTMRRHVARELRCAESRLTILFSLLLSPVSSRLPSCDD